MHPILITIGNFPVGTYGMAIVLGLAAALWAAGRRARARGLHPDFVFDLTFVLLLSGFIGARLVAILVDWRDFTADPWAMIFSRQGFVFWGGFLTALAAAVWFCRRRRVALIEVADIVTPSLVLAHAFGRVGCFMAGCCYGAACPAGLPPGHIPHLLGRLAVRYPLLSDAAGQPSAMFNFAYWGQIDAGLLAPGAGAPLPLLPVQLFEAAGNLLIFAGLLWLWRRRRFSGQVFAAYMLVYSPMRFGLEFLRGDAARGVWFGGTLSTSQIISLATFAGALAFWAARRGRGIVAPIAAPAPAADVVAPPAPSARHAAAGPRRRRKLARR
ncbi:MAG: prolipoprotein diacylglyceryl transferase [bacterium]|nr:prolipoprotein diacylglyceryl transferase [bacterium]